MRAVAALAVLAASAAAAVAAPAPAAARYRIVRDDYLGRTRIVWLDAHGRRTGVLRVDAWLTGRRASPRGDRVALGDELGRILVLDLRRRRIAGVLRPWGRQDGCGTVPLVWTTRHRLVAEIWCGSAHGTMLASLATVDLRTGRRVAARPLGTIFALSALPANGVVLVTSPPGIPDPRNHDVVERVGRARLLRIDRNGAVATTLLPIRAGMNGSRTIERFPGFALDRRHARAFVVGENDGVAEIDLRSLRVTLHRVAVPARPRRLASPPRPHEGTANPARVAQREALWLGLDRLVVTGSDVWTHGGYDRELAAGLRVVDLATGSSSLVGADVARELRVMVERPRDRRG
jgi:hypothetical protein